MITKKEIKEFLKNHEKKISKDALRELKEIIKKEIFIRLEKASKKANFSGRVIIKKQDLSSQ